MSERMTKNQRDEAVVRCDAFELPRLRDECDAMEQERDRETETIKRLFVVIDGLTAERDAARADVRRLQRTGKGTIGDDRRIKDICTDCTAHPGACGSCPDRGHTP